MSSAVRNPCGYVHPILQWKSETGNWMVRYPLGPCPGLDPKLGERNQPKYWHWRFTIAIAAMPYSLLITQWNLEHSWLWQIIIVSQGDSSNKRNYIRISILTSILIEIVKHSMLTFSSCKDINKSNDYWQIVWNDLVNGPSSGTPALVTLGLGTDLAPIRCRRSATDQQQGSWPTPTRGHNQQQGVLSHDQQQPKATNRGDHKRLRMMANGELSIIIKHHELMVNTFWWGMIWLQQQPTVKQETYQRSNIMLVMMIPCRRNNLNNQQPWKRDDSWLTLGDQTRAWTQAQNQIK